MEDPYFASTPCKLLKFHHITLRQVRPVLCFTVLHSLQHHLCTPLHLRTVQNNAHTSMRVVVVAAAAMPSAVLRREEPCSSHIHVGLARTIYIRCVCLQYLLGQDHLTSICRVGQNHIYTVYIWYTWQGNHQIYGHIRCIYTVLANPTYMTQHTATPYHIQPCHCTSCTYNEYLTICPHAHTNTTRTTGEHVTPLQAPPLHFGNAAAAAAVDSPAAGATTSAAAATAAWSRSHCLCCDA